VQHSAARSTNLNGAAALLRQHPASCPKTPITIELNKIIKTNTLYFEKKASAKVVR
jgi:hypothetical protein